MSQATAQRLVVTMAVPQSLDIQPAAQQQSAQPLTVTMGTGYIMVLINPAQTLPTD